MTKPVLSQSAWTEWEAQLRASDTPDGIIKSIREGFEVADDPSSAPPAPETRPTAPRSTESGTGSREADIRARAARIAELTDLSVADAMRRAERSYAIEHGEDIEPETAAEAAAQMERAIADDPDILTRPPVDPLQQWYANLSEEDRAAYHAKSGITDEDMQRTGGVDTQRMAAIAQAKALRAEAEAEHRRQVEALVKGGHVTAEEAEKHVIGVDSLEAVMRTQRGIRTESQKAQDAIRALPREAFGLAPLNTGEDQ